MTHTSISPVLPWALFVLGVGHISYGLLKFRTPLAQAAAAGFIGKFSATEDRRSAFWFVMFGPLLMLAGHVAVYAASVGDAHLIRVVGGYLLAISGVGAMALPRSPFVGGVALSGALLALGCGYL